jgi:hypothetical protein
MRVLNGVPFRPKQGGTTERVEPSSLTYVRGEGFSIFGAEPSTVWFQVVS